MLGQVLGRGLLGQAGTVQELPLQQGQVCLWWGEGVWTCCSRRSGHESAQPSSETRQGG